MRAQPLDGAAFGIASLGLTIRTQDPAWLKPCLTRWDLPVWVAADIRAQQGWAYYRASRFAEAQEAFRFACSLARDEDLRSEGEAMLGRAWVARRQCDIDLAADWAEEARKIGVLLRDVTLTLDAVNAQVEYFLARGWARRAEQELADADHLLEQGGIERIRGRLDGSRGQVRRHLTQNEAGLVGSRKLAMQSLETAERLGLRQDQMWRHFDLGIVHSLERDRPQAKSWFDRGLKLATDPELGPPDRWQESRFRQRLARLALIEQGADAAIPDLWMSPTSSSNLACWTTSHGRWSTWRSRQPTSSTTTTPRSSAAHGSRCAERSRSG